MRKDSLTQTARGGKPRGTVLRSVACEPGTGEACAGTRRPWGGGSSRISLAEWLRLGCAVGVEPVTKLGQEVRSGLVQVDLLTLEERRWGCPPAPGP